MTGGLFKFANKNNSYALNGQRGILEPARQSLRHRKSEVTDRDGYKYYLNYGKISGNFTWNVDHGIESHTYNPNDLGLLFGNNNITQSVNANYNMYKPFWKVNKLSTYAGLSYSLLEQPRRYQDAGVYAGGNTTFTKSFLTTGVNLDASPAHARLFRPAP